jgi:SlyX protein
MPTEREQARLIEVETKIAYQEKTIADLNEALVDLNRTVTELGRRLQAVEQVIRDGFEQRGGSNERPPHY